MAFLPGLCNTALSKGNLTPTDWETLAATGIGPAGKLTSGRLKPQYAQRNNTPPVV